VYSVRTRCRIDISTLTESSELSAFHSTEKFEGTGVGRSIAQRVLQRGGRIGRSAEVDKGETIYFSLHDDLIALWSRGDGR